MSDKTAASISDMARSVGLSRQRFHQLIVAGIFPAPLYDLATRRPFYNEEMQQVCLEVRRRNCGVNGKSILFYARRVVLSSRRKTPSRQNDKTTAHTDLIEGLKGLGMSTVSTSQIDVAIKEAMPQGTAGVAPADLLRAVFLHLQRKNRSDSVGR